MKKLIGIVGTNSDRSTNRDLLVFMKEHFKGQADIEILEIKDLPLFNKPENRELPECIKVMAKKIEEADGVIISTPEYDHAVPASLMSALNWLSYYIFPFLDKPVMITGASYGTLGSSRAQQHLRHMLDSPELKARIMPSSEFLLSHSLQAFSDEGKLKDEQQIVKLESLFKDFIIFVDVMKQLGYAHEVHKKEAETFSWEKL